MSCSSLQAISIIAILAIGCTPKQEPTTLSVEREKTKLEQEFSWTIETLKSTYFEGEVIWVVASPHITHNLDSVIAAARQTPGVFVSSYEKDLAGEIRVFRDNLEITDDLRDLSDAPKPRSIPLDKVSMHELQWYRQFLQEGHYSAFLDKGVRSDTIKFEILPTPDSLFTLRFVLLEDIGYEYTPKFPLFNHISTPTSTFQAWSRYLRRLMLLPQGYPYRAEGLSTALIGVASSKEKMKPSLVRYVSSAIVELSKEQPFLLQTWGNIARGWVGTLDDSLRKSESEWLAAAIPDTSFTNELFSKRLKPFPKVARPILPNLP